MKKYFTSVSGQTEQDIIEHIGENEISFNGKKLNYEFEFINNFTLLLRIESKNYYCNLIDNPDNVNFEIGLESGNYKVVCRSELETMLEKMSNGKSNERHKNEIHSPMPGVIKQLNIKEGQTVAKGDVLLVLEAMKMENEIKATRECVIKKINTEAFKSVEKNELLIILE